MSFAFIGKNYFGQLEYSITFRGQLYFMMRQIAMKPPRLEEILKEMDTTSLPSVSEKEMEKNSRKWKKFYRYCCMNYSIQSKKGRKKDFLEGMPVKYLYINQNG